MKKRLQIGVLGTANIAVRSMIPAIKSLPELYSLSGIASRDTKKSEYFAKQFNTINYVGYDSLIEKGHLDAVYIPLPNSLHFEWINTALHSGLHVLSEKSLACTEQEVITLNERAKEKNLVLIENFQFRFHSQLAYIKQLVSSGKIGELRYLRSSFGFPPFSDKRNIRYQKDLGGGALLDTGAYPLKISQIFLGNNLQVKAANLKFDFDKEVDIWGGAYLNQNNGEIFSEIAFGFDYYYQCSLELWGNKGIIYTNRIFTAPPGFEPVIKLETSSGKETIKLPADNHFKNMLIHFHDLINSKNGLQHEYTQNINQARLIEELKKKANEQ